VRLAGGEPFVLRPNADAPEDVASDFDGLLLAGGHDVDPALFHEPRHPTFVASEPGRDTYELALLRQAAGADLPVFAICRGIQILNVAHGGTLIQDIADTQPSALRHTSATPSSPAVHEVVLAEGSLLQRLMTAGGHPPSHLHVSSRHHQAVGRLGRALAVSATAPDGIIEAIEMPSQRFCLGVQWHPEEAASGAFAVLFRGLVDAAARRRRGTPQR
jgi:putative glutamine amidotransferase